jgi:hypothetical protein
MSDLADLFAKDPLNYTREDIDTVIRRFREANAQWQAGQKSAGSTKKMNAKSKEPETKVDLGDLGL